MGVPKVGIVILNYNTYELTISCLENLQSLNYGKFSVVVVDNMSPNNSYELIKRHINNNSFKYQVEIVQTGFNGGYSYGNNFGVKKVIENNADLVLVMNNDIVFENINFLRDAVNYMSKNNHVSLIGPGVIHKNEQIDLPLYTKRIEAIESIFGNIFYPLTIIKNNRLRAAIQKQKESVNVYSVSGCCFLIKSKVFKEIDYFDENLFLFGEELIIGEKLYQQKHIVHFVPDIRIYHEHSTTINSFYSLNAVSKMQMESFKYYITNYRKDISKIMRKLIFVAEGIKVQVYLPVVFILRKFGMRAKIN